MTEKSIIEAATQIAPLNQILFEYVASQITTPGVAQSLSTGITDCACYLTTVISCAAAVDGHIYVDYYKLHKKSDGPFYTEDIPFTAASGSFHTFTRQISSFYIRVRLELDSDPALQPPGQNYVSFYVVNIKS